MIIIFTLSFKKKNGSPVPNALFALLNAEFICSFQLKLDKIIPMSLSDSVFSKISITTREKTEKKILS